MIECKYGKQNRLFINHLGELIPCCHLNAEALNMAAGQKPKTQFGSLNKTYDNSLYSNTIVDVINGPLFKGIINSWDEVPVEKCRATCELKIRDSFEDKWFKK